MSNFTPAEYIRDSNGNLDLAAMWIARIERDSREALQAPYAEVTVRCEECKEQIEVDLPYLVGEVGFTSHSAIGMALGYHAEICEGYRNVEIAVTEDGEEIEVCGTCLSSRCCCQYVEDQGAGDDPLPRATATCGGCGEEVAAGLSSPQEDKSQHERTMPHVYDSSQEDPEMYDGGAASYGFDLDAMEHQDYQGEEEAGHQDGLDAQEEQACICGVVRSEHKHHGCRDGFIAPTVWARLQVIKAREVVTCQK